MLNRPPLLYLSAPLGVRFSLRVNLGRSPSFERDMNAIFSAGDVPIQKGKYPTNTRKESIVSNTSQPKVGRLSNQSRSLAVLLFLTILTLALLPSLTRPTNAAVVIGDRGENVIFGPDNDNAQNSFIQPEDAGPQSLNNTDLLVGRNGDDLLIGLLGNDVIDGRRGDDITIGGVENFVGPNSDVIDGGSGDDINIWAPGDGSDLYVGGRGHDAQIFAPILLDDNGIPELFYAWKRQIPRVDITNKPQFSCTIEEVPAEEEFGFQFVTRFFANGNLAVTVRLKDVEQVFCPSPNAHTVLVADLTGHEPTTFVERPIRDFRYTLIGKIIQP